MENVFTLQKRATLAKLLRDASSIGIIASTRQNFDTTGAALGLMLALSSSNKKATVVSSKDPLVEISNLFGIDKIQKTFDSSIKQLTISFPFVEGEIEKAMYKTEGNKINVHFYAAKDKAISFNEQDVNFIKKGGTPDLIFAIAVSDDEIAEFVQDPKSVKIIRISRHPKDTSGDVVYQDTSFSSVSEIVSKVVQEQGLALDADAAQNLLDGILFSTQSYTHPKTSAFAFDATGYLLKKGAQRKSVTEIKEEAEDTGSVDPEVKKSDQSQEQEDEQVMFDAPKEEKEKKVSEAQSSPTSMTNESEKKPEEDQKATNGEAKAEKKKSDFDKNNDSEGEDQVPSDWFEPKVFKSSKSN